MIERIIRGVAGVFVLTGLTLGYFVHPAWLILAAFAGLNLFQSSFTRWCLLEDMLKKTSLRDR